MTDFLSTPDGLTAHHLPHDGCPLHYWLGGNPTKPTLVMLHGASNDHRSFNAQVTAFMPGYQVLVWDGRGHGASQPMGKTVTVDVFTNDLLRILDRHGIESCVVIGHSLGGFIGQRLYHLAPERVVGLVMIGTVPLAKAYPPWVVWGMRAVTQVFRVIPYAWIISNSVRGIAVGAGVGAYFADVMRKITPNDYLTIWRSFANAITVEDRTADWKLEVPLLLLLGEREALGPPRWEMPRWTATDSHAEFHRVPGAGHNAHQDNPATVNQFIRDFLTAHGI